MATQWVKLMTVVYDKVYFYNLKTLFMLDLQLFNYINFSFKEQCTVEISKKKFVFMYKS